MEEFLCYEGVSLPRGSSFTIEGSFTIQEFPYLREYFAPWKLPKHSFTYMNTCSNINLPHEGVLSSWRIPLSERSSFTVKEFL